MKYTIELSPVDLDLILSALTSLPKAKSQATFEQSVLTSLMSGETPDLAYKRLQSELEASSMDDDITILKGQLLSTRRKQDAEAAKAAMEKGEVWTRR